MLCYMFHFETLMMLKRLQSEWGWNPGFRSLSSAIGPRRSPPEPLCRYSRLRPLLGGWWGQFSSLGLLEFKRRLTDRRGLSEKQRIKTLLESCLVESPRSSSASLLGTAWWIRDQRLFGSHLSHFPASAKTNPPAKQAMSPYSEAGPDTGPARSWASFPGGKAGPSERRAEQSPEIGWCRACAQTQAAHPEQQ